MIYIKGEGIRPDFGAEPPRIRLWLVSPEFSFLFSTPPGGSPSFGLNGFMPPNKVWFSEVCVRLRQGPEF